MRVSGNPILIVGDLHYSAVYKGQHIDYFDQCCKVLNKISEELNARKPSALVLLGDIVGMSENNIKDHQALHILMKVLHDWNDICPVFSLVGNHDISGHPDFLILHDIGLIKTATDIDGYIDYAKDELSEPCVRLHFLDYGCARHEIHLLEGKSNIVLGHDNYQIEGVTTWYPYCAGYEIASCSNLEGIDGIIAGHIHVPSDGFVSTRMLSGKEVWLIYPGCPTRPVRRPTYEKCMMVAIGQLPTGSASVDIIPWVLEPSDTIYIKEDALITVDASEAILEKERKQALTAVLDDLLKYHIATGDPISQVDKITDASEGAKKIAKEYLQRAFNQGG